MAISDIQKLRAQAIFSPIPDMSGGTMDMSLMPTQSAIPPMMSGRGVPSPFGNMPSQTDVPSAATPNASGMPAQASSGVAGLGAPPSQKSAAQALKEYADTLNQAYTPDTMDRDRLRALMDKFPEEKPVGFGRALVAAALSVKAQDPVKTADSVMGAPFRSDLEKWTAQVDPYYKTAQLENQQNINERTLLSNAATAMNTTNKLGEQGREADQKAEIARIRAENDNIRARAYAAKNNGYTVMVAGDRIVAVNPDTKQRIDLGDSGKLDEATKLDITGEWNVKAQEARGAAGIATAQAGAQATGKDVILIGGKPYKRNLNPTPQNPDDYIPATGTGGTTGDITKIGAPKTSPTTKTNTLEADRVKNDKLSAAYQTDPIGKQYVKNLGGGKYDFQPRPVLGATVGGIFGYGGSKVTQDDVNKYDEFRSSIDPTYTPPRTGGVSPSGITQTPSTGGLGPSPATVTKGITPTAPTDTSDVSRQRAIGYLIEHNKAVTEANIQYAIKTGRLQPDSGGQ